MDNQKKLKYLSVCSGIEGASVAWHDLPFEPVAFSEIEKFPSAVLRNRFPNVPNLGDFTAITKETLGQDIDLLIGGSPCQSFSQSGLRLGLNDPRGNLTIEYARLAQRLKPEWIVWENVPGILSIDGGDTFRMFLDMLADIGYICDTDILDAQYFGVPQRRKRVFIVGQHRDNLLAQNTVESAQTILQAMIECCNLAKDIHNKKSKIDSVEAIAKRMELFGMNPASEYFPMLQISIAAECYQTDCATPDIGEFATIISGINNNSTSMEIDCLSPFVNQFCDIIGESDKTTTTYEMAEAAANKARKYFA